MSQGALNCVPCRVSWETQGLVERVPSLWALEAPREDQTAETPSPRKGLPGARSGIQRRQAGAQRGPQEADPVAVKAQPWQPGTQPAVLTSPRTPPPPSRRASFGVMSSLKDLRGLVGRCGLLP